VVGLRFQEGAQSRRVVLDDAKENIRGLELGGLVPNFEDASELCTHNTRGSNRCCRAQWPIGNYKDA
jgi:hypothetical protein